VREVDDEFMAPAHAVGGRLLARGGEHEQASAALQAAIKRMRSSEPSSGFPPVPHSRLRIFPKTR
jgi:hypothetical protein